MANDQQDFTVVTQQPSLLLDSRAVTTSGATYTVSGVPNWCRTLMFYTTMSVDGFGVVLPDTNPEVLESFAVGAGTPLYIPWFGPFAPTVSLDLSGVTANGTVATFAYGDASGLPVEINNGIGQEVPVTSSATEPVIIAYTDNSADKLAVTTSQRLPVVGERSSANAVGRQVHTFPSGGGSVNIIVAPSGQIPHLGVLTVFNNSAPESFIYLQSANLGIFWDALIAASGSVAQDFGGFETVAGDTISFFSNQAGVISINQLYWLDTV